MTVSLGTFIDQFHTALVTTGHIFAKGQAHVVEAGADPATMLEWRLAEDMHPLSFQLAAVIDFTKGWSARAAGVDVPERTAWQTTTVAAFNAAIADANVFVRAIDRDAVNARADEVLTVQITDTMAPTMPVERWITGFASTNIQFHLAMTYAILRLHGVPLGKLDMFSTGL